MSATAIQPPVGAARADQLPAVRRGVRRALEATPAFRDLEPVERRRLAELIVRVGQTAAALAVEQAEAEPRPAAIALAAPEEASPPVARALDAGGDFSGVAASRVGAQVTSTLNAVSFPRFVTDLLTGVFTAMIDSSQRQMHMYIDLLDGVAASTEGFAGGRGADDAARQWLADRYPDTYALEPAPSDDPEHRGVTAVVRRDDGQDPPQAALRLDLGLGDKAQLPDLDEPEGELLGLVRRQVAKRKQETLATLVMLGMQRIVVESGRINASMRLHVDTHSAAAADSGSRFELDNKIKAAGSFGAGPWGVSAAVENTINYVTTETSSTTEEMNTSVDLGSAVDIVFRSDYLPLGRLASDDQVQRIRENSRNPEANTNPDADRAASRASEGRRQDALHSALRPTVGPGAPLAPPPAPKAPAADKVDPKAGKPADPGKSAAPPVAKTPPPAAKGTPPKPPAVK